MRKSREGSGLTLARLLLATDKAETVTRRVEKFALVMQGIW